MKCRIFNAHCTKQRCKGSYQTGYNAHNPVMSCCSNSWWWRCLLRVSPLVCLFAYIVTLQFCAAQTPPFFNVKDYGAVGDGTALDSPAINGAIAAAGAQGGGTVIFPAGTYLCGSLHLTNNLTLYLSNNAVIWGSQANIDPHEANPFSQYQDQGHSYFHDALIWGENLTNLTFTGAGKIDGHGALATGNPSSTTPGDKVLCLVLCTNITITGITITNGGHFGILAQACANMLVAGARIWERTSRDGFNLIDSSYVVITNCSIEGSDDAMCLKSTYALGRKIGEHNVQVRNCQILSTENNATQFGSETVGDFSDISFSDLVLTGAGKAGIGITSQDGAVIDGVTYDNITMSNCACPIFLKLDYRTTDTPNPAIGRIRNISINNVAAYHSTLFNRTNTSTINGYTDGNSTIVPIENITFRNVNVSNIGKNPATAITNVPVETQDWQPNTLARWPSYGWYLRWAGNISFTNCQVRFDNNDDRPAVSADTVTNVLFNGFIADVGSNNTNYDMGFRNTTAGYDVTNAIASANAPSPGSALRIQNSNSVSGVVVSPPYFTPGDGLYASPQAVAIASGTPAASIRYTTDGTTPTSSSGLIYSGPVTIGSETVLRAVAYTNGLVDSAVNTAIYTFTSANLTVSTPTFTPPAGTYASTQLVAIATMTAGASIRYTTDGSTPSSTNGIIYSVPVAINSSMTLEAIAYGSNLVDSAVNSGNYTITGIAATPSFNPPAGTYSGVQSVTISSATGDAAIRYTTDGSDPSSVNGTLYSSPVLISATATLKAIAFATGATDSSINAGTYSIVAAPPTLTFEAELIPFVTNGATAAEQFDVNSSDGAWEALQANTNGSWIEFTLANVPAGKYQLALKWKGNTSNRGIITHTVDGVPLGDSLDLYSSAQTYPETNLAIITFTNSGNQTVRQTVIGKGPVGSGARWTSADKFTLTLVQSLPSSITGVFLLTNGSIQMTGAGYPSLGYLVQASTNLGTSNWVNIGNITADTSGNLFFLDTNAATQSVRFYRFVAP